MSQLPSGWREVPLSRLGSEIRGSETPLPGVNYQLWSVPSFSTGTPELVDGAAIGSAKRRVMPGDVLVCKINPRINRVWLVGDSPADRVQIASTEWLVFRVTNPAEVLPEYLRWYMTSPAFRDWITLSAVGATGSHTRAKSGSILQQRIPIVETDEQRRIVGLLEDHMSRLDEAEGLVSRSMSSMSTLAQLLVESAVSDSGPVRPLRDLTVSSGYGTSEKCIEGGPGVAVVRIPNLESGSINLSDEKRVRDQSADLARLMLEPGDLLVIRTNGSRDLIGRAAVVQEGVTAAFASYLIRFQLDRSLVDPEWVRVVLSAPSSRRLLESLAASSAGQYNLSLSKLGGVPIPVPALARQAELLESLSSSLEVITRAQAECARQGERARRLRRSLLSSAFSGRLTDMSDAPKEVEEYIDV